MQSRGFRSWCAALTVCLWATPSLPAQPEPTSAVRSATKAEGTVTKKRRVTSKRRATSTPRSPKIRAAAKRTFSAPAPLRYTAPVGPSQLVLDLDHILARSTRSGSWGVAVISVARGDTLFTRNADRPLLPASTMKLFTASVALERFGPDHRFITEVLREGAVGRDGVLRGHLVLRGSGDPSFSRRFSDLASGETPLETMARLVGESGVRRVSGDVVGDATAFEERAVPEGWRSRYLHSSYAARVSALSYNENLLTVSVKPEGRTAGITFDPALSGIAVENKVRVVAGRGGRISVVQRDHGLEIRGTVGAAGSGRRVQVVTEYPALITTAAFRAALEARGIAVGGTTRLGASANDAPRVAALPSAPLGDIITTMNGESNNHFAELVFRNAARTLRTVGSAENGNILLRRFLSERANVLPTDVYAADGSGLSTADRVTPRAMVQLLNYAAKASWRDVFEQSLPVAGRTETLRRRMKATPAMGNLRAKTGTTNEVASLGGYVTSRDGERLAFSFIYNGTDRWRAKAAMDAMGATLANYQR